MVKSLHNLLYNSKPRTERVDLSGKSHRLRNEMTGSRLHDLDGYQKPFHQSYRFAYSFLDIVPRQKDEHSSKAYSETVHRKVHLIAQPVGSPSHEPLILMSKEFDKRSTEPPGPQIPILLSPKNVYGNDNTSAMWESLT